MVQTNHNLDTQINDLDTQINTLKVNLNRWNKNNEKELLLRGYDVLREIEKIRKLNNQEDESKLLGILQKTNKILMNREQPEQVIQGAQELAKLATDASGKPSTLWKSLGTSLVLFAYAALVVAGIALAVPTAGGSLLLSAIGTIGLTGSIGVGAGVAATGALGASARYYGGEKGLAKSINALKEACIDYYENPNTHNSKKLSTPTNAPTQPTTSKASFETMTSISQEIREQIKTAINGNIAGTNKDLLSITVENIDTTLEHNLQIFERLKHPIPWTYTRIDPTSPNDKTIIKIKYDPTQELNEENTKIQYSIKTRKLSIIGGVLTLLDHQGYAPHEIANIKKVLADECNEICDDKNQATLDPKTEIDHFVRKLAASIEQEIRTKDRNIIREIREAERYFVAEHNKNQILIVETKTSENETIYQIDVELNHQLTSEQKKEYLKIHRQGEEPEWFTELSKAEQEWFKSKIPQSLEPSDAKWHDFESL